MGRCPLMHASLYGEIKIKIQIVNITKTQNV